MRPEEQVNQIMKKVKRDTLLGHYQHTGEAFAFAFVHLSGICNMHAKRIKQNGSFEH